MKNKLNKILGIFLSVSMMMGITAMPIQAEDTAVINYSQDFEGENPLSDFTNGSGYYQAGSEYYDPDKSGRPQPKITEKDGSRWMELDKELCVDNILLTKALTEVNTGRVAVDFTIYADNNILTFVKIKRNAGNKDLLMLQPYNGFLAKCYNQGTTWFDTPEPQYLKVHFILDLDKQTGTYLLTDENDGIFMKNYTGVNTGANSFGGIVINSYQKGESGKIYIDDIKITNTNITELADIEKTLSPAKESVLPINDNFDSYESITDVSSWWKVSPTKTDTQAREVTLETGSEDKAIKLNGNNAAIYKNLTSNPLTTGKIKVSANIKPSNRTAFGFVSNGEAMNDAGTIKPIFYFINDKVYTFLTDENNELYVGTFTPGNEYILEAEIDMDKKMMNVKMTGITNTAESAEKKDVNIEVYNTKFNVNSITAFGVAHYGGTLNETVTYFDDFKAEYIGLATPSLSSDKIEFYDDDTKITNTTEGMSPNVNKIKLDFGTVMNQFSVRNKISITDSNGGRVLFRGMFDDSKYVIDIFDRLSASETYTLNVPKSVANELGTTMEDAFTMEFATNAGEIFSTLVLKNSDGTNVEALNGLAEGQNVRAEMEYVNSTGKAVDAFVCFSYYNGNKLVKCSIEPISLTAADKKGNAYATHTVDSLTGIDNVKVMFWDRDSLVPFADAVDLK